MRNRNLALGLSGVVAWLLFTGAGYSVSLAEDLSPSRPITVPANLQPLKAGVSEEVYGLSDDIFFAEQRVQANPDDPESWFLMGVAYSKTPYVERALLALDKSKRLARKSPGGFAIFDKKIAEYEKMQADTPDDATLLYAMSFGYYMRGYAVQHGYIKDSSRPPDHFYAKAESTLRHLLSLDPQHYVAMNYLGFFLAEQDPEGNLNEAVALWEKSLQLNQKENPGAYVLLGQAALKKGNLRQAVEYTAQAMKARNAWLEAHHIDPSKVKIKL